MKTLRKKTLLAVLSLFSLLTAQAQSSNNQGLMPRKNYKTWSFTVGGGLLLARADVKQYDWYPVGSYNNERRFGFYAGLTKTITPALGLQGQILRGNVAGVQRKQSLYFDADIWDFSLNAVLNLRNLIGQGTAGKKKFNYYFTVGAGLSQFKSKLKRLGGPQKDSTIYSFGYGEFGGPTTRTTETFINTGLSVKYSINNDFDLGMDFMYRNLNSDKLDAFVSLDKTKDNYYLTAVSLTYHLGKKNAKPYERVDPTNTMYEQLQAMQNKLDSITRDSDGNGVPDAYEKKDKAGTSAATSPDTDGDGVPDKVDVEPFSNKGARVDTNGKELDDDEDGIANSKDMEPNTPKGSLVNFQGKTIVAKNVDEVRDDKFDFKNAPPIPDNKKVPVNTSSKGVVASISNSVPVFFSSNNAAVSEKYVENLAAIALYMKANPDVQIKLIGHTDAVASAAYNNTLGLKRAQIVKEYLVRNFRIKASRIITESKGETELLSPTINEVNRRVEVQVIR